MPLKLLYITNRPAVARLADKYGTDRIWIDLEKLGKEERQRGNTVKSHHCVEDIARIKPLLSGAEMLVRVDPWNTGSPEQINAVIGSGADIIMLPYWKTAEEVTRFLDAVDGRARTTLLLETKEAADIVDEILPLPFDEIHIGLNDLHLSYGMDFIFEPLADGTVEALCSCFRKKGVPYGFGGIARLGKGMVPAEKIIMEHYRLGSTRAILSRSFCDLNKCEEPDEMEELFAENMARIRAYEALCAAADEETLRGNMLEVREAVRKISGEIREKKKQEAL